MADLASGAANGAATMAARGGADLDDDAPLFGTDDFRMFQMKIQPCAKRFVHDWVTCPFSHPGEKAKRRDPRYFVYTGIACPSMKKAGACPRGEKCPYAHNVFEYWLHPTRYRTQLCNDGMGCRRRVCFFAHSLAQLRVPATKPFVPPEVLAALEGPQSSNPAAMAAVSEAMKRISDSWQAGSRRADQPPQSQPHDSEAAQIESRMLEHLCGGAPAEQVVQQLRATSEDALTTDAALQARLAGALAAIKRSRSADDGQEALIQMLQGMLTNAAQQQQGNQGDEGGDMHTSSASSLWDRQQQLLQHAQQTAQLQQLQHAQAQMYAHGSPGSAEWPTSNGASQEPQGGAWRRTTHSLPALREHSVVADSGSSGVGSGSPSVDYSQGGGIHPAKLQSLLGAAAASASNSYSSGGRPLTPTAAEEYASWVASGGYDASQRRSLQYDTRPGPARGHYPRRRSLQVGDWRPAPNPFAHASDQWGYEAGVYAPVPLQGFMATEQAGPYNNMFEGWRPGAAVNGLEAPVAAPYAGGSIQSTFLHPAAGAPGELHFPAGWHAQRQQAPRGSLDSGVPRAGGYPSSRQSIDVQPRPASDAFAQRLSLDANMLRGPSEAPLWAQAPGPRFGATARHSDTVNYAGLGPVPSAEYVVNVDYGAGADIPAQSDSGGDQLGPLPTQAQLRRGSHSPATSGSNPGTPAQQLTGPEEHLSARLSQLYMHNAPLQHSQA